MKFSVNWLALLAGGIEISPKSLGDLITRKTAEQEGVEEIGSHFPQVCTARVLSVEHIEGSKNVKAVVDTGRYGTKQVVCGAPNCRAGIVTAYVPAGTALHGKRIDKAVIAGIESDGMLASGSELGLNRDHEAILDLSGAEPGAPIPGCLPDAVIDIDNKSLTHRPDLWGHLGMAREVAAIVGGKLTDPVNLARLPAGPPSIEVEVEDHTLCPRYSALVFDNVTVQPSPLWLQYRLQSLGLNPISNVVDVTNYVMAELGQPMHAFDQDKLAGSTISVRRAKPGEHIEALNDETYSLDERDLVIADSSGPIALAGIIGGMPSGVGKTTTRIILESANFHAATIRRTSSRLKLRTDASMRFEKAQDPVNTVRGLARAVELLEEVSPGIRLVGGLADNWIGPSTLTEIELPLPWLRRKIGRDITAAEVRQILEALWFQVRDGSGDSLVVIVPTWRATKDVSIKDDLVEEVGRMIGYENITPTAPLVPAVPPPSNPEREFHRKVRDMCAAQGFTEVYNYSFISEEQATEIGLDPASHVRVLNPISSEQSLLRTTLVPGILKNVRDNKRHLDRFCLVEIGNEIHRSGTELPVQTTHLAAALYTRSGDGVDRLMEAKRLAECLLPQSEVQPTPAQPWEHPARSYNVVWRGASVGRIGEFHPRLVEEGRAAVLDLDLDAILALGATSRIGPSISEAVATAAGTSTASSVGSSVLSGVGISAGMSEALGIGQSVASERKRHKPLRKFPTSEFDLSVIAAERDLVGQIRAKLAAQAIEEVIGIEYVRQYSGPPLAEGTKSVSFRVMVGAPDRTLSSDEIGDIRQKLIAAMQGAGYELRI